MNKKDIETIIDWSRTELMFRKNQQTGVNRFQSFLAIMPLLKGKNYWSTLGAAYRRSDMLYYYSENIKRAFESTEPFKDHLMNKEEHKFLSALPDTLTIYRGMSLTEFKSKNFGASWTLDIKIAEFFAYKYGRSCSPDGSPRKVCKLKVNKRNIIAYFNEREESEVIYIHKSLEDRAKIPE